MKKLTRTVVILILTSLFCLFTLSAYSRETGSLIGVTPAVKEYAFNVVKPILDSYEKKDELSQLLKVSEIITDPGIGVQTNAIEPSKFIIYDKLEMLKLGVLYTLNLTPQQKQLLKHWRSRFMQSNPADVFFAPAADDIIKTKAAFGCSHYARSFMAVVKALDLVANPKDIRYTISSKSDTYNQALAEQDKEMTINGHQFVIVKISNKWIALNTSKAEWVRLPEGFVPESVAPPSNISIRFPAYPEVTFLLRKIGVDIHDDCGDDSFVALMNIYRSGDRNNPNFKWDKYSDTNS